MILSQDTDRFYTMLSNNRQTFLPEKHQKKLHFKPLLSDT